MELSDEHPEVKPKHKKHSKKKKILKTESLEISSNGTEEVDYDDTLEEWKKRGSQIAFIFDSVLEKYTTKIKRYTLVVFMLTSITSLISLGNLGLSEQDYPELSWTVKITNVVISIISAFCAAKIRIMGWQNLVTQSQKYLDTVEAFVATVVSELSLPSQFRSPPEQFILQNKDRFLTILGTAPDIPHSDYLKAMEKYTNSKNRFRQDLISV